MCFLPTPFLKCTQLICLLLTFVYIFTERLFIITMTSLTSVQSLLTDSEYGDRYILSLLHHCKACDSQRTTHHAGRYAHLENFIIRMLSL